MVSFLKKYWFIIVSFFGAILAGFVIAKNKERREEVKDEKTVIKKTNAEIKHIEKLKEKLEKEREETTVLIKQSKDKTTSLEKEIITPAKKNKDTQKAKDKLKKIARG